MENAQNCVSERSGPHAAKFMKERGFYSVPAVINLRVSFCSGDTAHFL